MGIIYCGIPSQQIHQTTDGFAYKNLSTSSSCATDGWMVQQQHVWMLPPNEQSPLKAWSYGIVFPRLLLIYLMPLKRRMDTVPLRNLGSREEGLSSHA
ncbi:hypothetical protein BC937DRAFT_88111 [Endogone sp. FLAS-F59071]|nr:hypothetical protein BC937DRAFT_88111 [Endogone sp. FLAS-F59071]|eukprot:RUS18979.1 hypothetical protein BC937DRAFT_88111 [Endogone sp. FLAS-F59071]